MNATRRLALVALLSCLASQHAAAQPPGLRAGDVYHVAFVTSDATSVTGDRSVPPPSFNNFGGVPAAEWIITFSAAASGFGETLGLSMNEYITGDYALAWDFITPHWQVILSDSAPEFGSDGDAFTRLQLDGPLYNTALEKIADDKFDLFDGAIDAPILYDEFGVEVSGNLDVWSGTSPSGFWTGTSCNDWDDPSSSNDGDIGSAGFTDSQWLSSGGNNCNESARLYGISPAFTVPVRGDFNGDGLVDAADYTLWRDSRGQTGPGLAADANGDEVVDQLDYDLWALDFGYESASVSVPEPAAMLSLTLSGLLCFLRRRHAR